MMLLGLELDIQEEIFFLPPVTEGRPVVTERDLRQVLKTVVWSEQREPVGGYTDGAVAIGHGYSDPLLVARDGYVSGATVWRTVILGTDGRV
jgi:hypothetical protein